MIPLFTNQEFDDAGSRDLLAIRCTACNEIFFKPKNYIQAIQSEKQHTTGDFCSPKCRNTSRRKRIAVFCAHCGVGFIKHPCNITENNFCSRSCAITYRNIHKTHGTRVSKLELWLQGQLPNLFPDLEFHFNRKDAIDSELDIYIPTLKLAFELNGIFHYEPIHGPDKLKQIQNNDSRKLQACIERGIEFCSIDVSMMKKFTEKGANKYLENIADIVGQCWGWGNRTPLMP